MYREDLKRRAELRYMRDKPHFHLVRTELDQQTYKLEIVLQTNKDEYPVQNPLLVALLETIERILKHIA